MLKESFFTPQIAKRLLSRIEEIPQKLYAHSYAFNLNYRHGDFNIFDICNFASKHNLSGICTHISGDKVKKSQNLMTAPENEIRKIKLHLRNLKLNINLDISTTSPEHVTEAVEVAKTLGIKEIRVYIRYGGKLLDIIKKGTEDLKGIADIAEKNKINFVLEPHEVLKSTELVEIIEAVDSERVNLLFDFANMVNAGEQPLDALKIMSPYIRHVHIKDVKIEPDRAGYKQIGVEQGTGDLPIMQILAELILLGEETPQVLSYALEQVSNYIAPAYRFADEPDNPFILDRLPSLTKIKKGINLEETLAIERQLAVQQVEHVKGMLKEIETTARAYMLI